MMEVLTQPLVIDHDTVSVIARKLAVSWHTANSAILAEGHRLLINDPTRFDGVSVIGVDEHVWRHTRRGDKYVTVIIDLTPISQATGPARLLDMMPGRSKQVFKQWLKARPKDWRDGIDVVAMDGFSGFKTASVEELPDAVEVMDPFHVVKLAGDALDDVRRRIQQETTGHRGRACPFADLACHNNQRNHCDNRISIHLAPPLGAEHRNEAHPVGTPTGNQHRGAPPEARAPI
jgi:transposase